MAGRYTIPYDMYQSFLELENGEFTQLTREEIQKGFITHKARECINAIRAKNGIELLPSNIPAFYVGQYGNFIVLGTLSYGITLKNVDIGVIEYSIQNLVEQDIVNVGSFREVTLKDLSIVISLLEWCKTAHLVLGLDADGMTRLDKALYYLQQVKEVVCEHTLQ